MAVSYLVSEEQWSVEDAIQRFTARRMRNGFGPGISIPSQVRWLGYVDWWTKHGKVYVERQVEIVEVHVWGLRDGVKVAIEGYVEEGKIIKTFHTFTRHERTLMDGSNTANSKVETPIGSDKSLLLSPTDSASTNSTVPSRQSTASTTSQNSQSTHEPGGAAALFRPSVPVILPSSDVNIDFERRNKAKYGFTMVTSVAHVWFNAYFESQYAQQKSASNPATSPSAIKPQTLDAMIPPNSGVFSIHWDSMDGIKGSARKGTRAFDQLSVVWRTVAPSPTTIIQPDKIITQAPVGEATGQTGASEKTEFSHLVRPEKRELQKNLGLRTESPHGRDISRANSPISAKPGEVKDDDSEMGIKPYIPSITGDAEGKTPNDDSRKVGIEDTKKDAEAQDLPEFKQKIPGQVIATPENN